jgi:hypothetical protein
VHAVVSKAFGTTAAGGGTALDLFVCYRSTIIGSGIQTVGTGMADLTAPPNSRQLYTLSADFEPGDGTFNIGLCGSTPSPASWNNNDHRYVTAILHE